jgi:hypothetical protein
MIGVVSNGRPLAFKIRAMMPTSAIVSSCADHGTLTGGMWDTLSSRLFCLSLDSDAYSS